MSNRKVLELFYDVVSPYSWLGFEILLRYKNIWNVDIRLCPGYLAGVMNTTGSLSAMRFVTTVQMSHPEFLEEVSRNLWLRIWSEDKDITEPESILQGKHRVTKRGPALSNPMFTLVNGIVGRWRAVCVTALQRPNSDTAAIRIVVGIAAASLSVTAAKKAGMPEDLAKKLLTTITSPEVKNKLKETTEKALAYGVSRIIRVISGVLSLFPLGTTRLSELCGVTHIATLRPAGRTISPVTFTGRSRLGTIPQYPEGSSLHSVQVSALFRKDLSSIPQVVSAFHINEDIVLPSFCPSPVHPLGKSLHKLDMVRAIRVYLSRTASFRQSDSLFVISEGRRKGLQASKSMIFRWIRSAIKEAYRIQEKRPSPGCQHPSSSIHPRLSVSPNEGSKKEILRKRMGLQYDAGDSAKL
ncbi:unnamed protein product [Ranitomeya imitator]|uniref:DSBA-like thioredoxin domain-containing protein n=1 Tax=Ranitomeya imitator TaxID=111125 RepID=A0ABN9L555_9NEOB|nr:unnamed protein product [Ranitomeya imitator]